jgi:F0F1-type ATP synthase delta subunit
MIGREERILGARYAAALLAINQEPFSEEACNALREAIHYYTTTPMVLIYLQTPLLDAARKREALALIRMRFKLPSIIEKIDLLLLEHARFFLLPVVYTALIYQSNAQAGRITCTVTSAGYLSSAQQHACKEFVQAVSGKKPLIEWVEHSALIAGMRIQTEDWLWEDSLDARLRALANTLLI